MSATGGPRQGQARQGQGRQGQRQARQLGATRAHGHVSSTPSSPRVLPSTSLWPHRSRTGSQREAMPNKLTHTGSDRVPLVSVIIPTLDRPEFLQAALRSVLRQTIADFEVLVIDDGSATDLLPFLNALDDGRIRYFRHESTRGEAAARNTGLLERTRRLPGIPGRR
jgi:Glycosyl transferase family 2